MSSAPQTAADRRTSDFYVSYARADESRVRWIAQVLTDAGYSVAVDFEELIPGVDWKGALSRALEGTNCLLAVLSASYLESDYARDEYVTAHAWKKRIFPVRIEDVPPPRQLAEFQYLDLVGLEPDAAAERLRRAAKQLLPGTEQRPPPAKAAIRLEDVAWQSAIARIEEPDGATVGGGVLVEPGVVLTLTYVLQAAHGRHGESDEPPREPVRVSLPFAEAAASGQVDQWLTEQPFIAATLRLSESPAGARPARFRSPQTNDEVRLFGFPNGFDEGVWASARVLGSLPNGLVQLQAAGGSLGHGFGGAPVWDPATGELLGITHSVARDQAIAQMLPAPALVQRLNISAGLPPPRAERTATTEGGTPTAATPPSARVHADRWTLDDRLDYALYAKAIAEFIRHPDATPPMVISVQAPWGQGKTSLMRMVQADLDGGHPDLLSLAHLGATAEVEPPSELTFGELRESLDGAIHIRETKPAAIRTVWFNAWKYQSSEQIWAGLAHAILSQLPARLSPKDRELFWLRLQLRRIDPSAVRRDIHRAALERFLPRLASWLALAIGLLVVAGVTVAAGGLRAVGAGVAGGGLLAAVGGAQRAWKASTREVLQKPLEGAYLRYVRQPDYEGKLGYLHLVEEDMVRALDLLTPDDQPAVIFIDDLDRCSPGKIGEVLEAVNLFLAGDYPNCAFVIGIDAEVVAASMEVLHDEIIGKLDNRRGELGWRFMDKFVQLPFVLPRLQPDQRDAYLRGLMWTPPPEEAGELLSAANRLESEIRADALPVDESVRRAAELVPKLATIAPARARALGEEVVSAGARAFSDDDPANSGALVEQLPYLSDNPRTIKRAVNLYRFHRFTAFARQASALPLDVASPEQIGRWVVIIIRWPHFVRWLQAQRDEQAGDNTREAIARVTALARETETLEAFRTALGKDGIEVSWTRERELWEFLREKTPPELDLRHAAACGLW